MKTPFYNEFLKRCPFSDLETSAFSKTGSNQKKTKKHFDFFLLGLWQIADLVNLHEAERYISWFSGIP